MVTLIMVSTFALIAVGVIIDLTIMRFVSWGRHAIRIKEGIEDEYVDIPIREYDTDLEGILQRELAKERKANPSLPSERRRTLSDFDIIVKARGDLVNKFHKAPRGSGYITLYKYRPDINAQDPLKEYYPQ